MDREYYEKANAENHSIISGRAAGGAGAGTVRDPLLHQLIGRLNEAQNTVADVNSLLDNLADRAFGEVPAIATNGPSKAELDQYICGGALGEVFSQVSILERRLEELRAVAQRVLPLA